MGLSVGLCVISGEVRVDVDARRWSAASSGSFWLVYADVAVGFQDPQGGVEVVGAAMRRWSDRHRSRFFQVGWRCLVSQLRTVGGGAGWACGHEVPDGEGHVVRSSGR